MNRVRAPAGSRDILYGETPYGWRLARDRSKLVLDEGERRILAVIRHMYFAERMPMRAIVAELDAMGIRNRRGSPFGLARVFEIVHGAGRKVRSPGRPRG